MGNDTKKYTIGSGNDLELFKKKFSSSATETEKDIIAYEADNMLYSNKEPESNNATGSVYAARAIMNMLKNKVQGKESAGAGPRANTVPTSTSTHTISPTPLKHYSQNMAIGRNNSPEQVKKIQNALGIKADGIYGSETRAAVIRFQRDNDLLVDGIAGPQTLGKLFRYANGTGMEDKYSAYADTSIAKRDLNSSAVIPSTGMESKQSTYDAEQMLKPFSAVYKPSEYGTLPKIDIIKSALEQKKTEEDNQPSWGEVASSAIGEGIAQTQAGMFNLPRKVIEGVSIGLDKVLPDSIYNKEMQNNDPIKRALDKVVASNEQRAAQYQKTLDATKGLKKFVSLGIGSIPQILMAGVGGAAMSGIGGATTLGSSSAISKLPTAAKQLIPFGTLAGSGYAREAENEGASYGQQMAYGLLGGTAEAATEVLPLENALDLLKKFGAGKIAEEGAKTLIGKYGKTAIKVIKNLALEGFQEGVMSPLSRGAQKMTYKPDLTMSGENGVFDLRSMGEDAYSGVAMAVILGALGLPSTYASHRLAEQMIESGKPITPNSIQNELIPTMQQDTEKIEGEQTTEIGGQTGEQSPTPRIDNKNTVSEVINSNPVSSINFEDLESTGLPKELVYALRQIKLGTLIPNDIVSKYPELQRILNGEISVDDFVNVLDGRQLITPSIALPELQEGQLDNGAVQTINNNSLIPQNNTEQTTINEKGQAIETIEQQGKDTPKTHIENEVSTKLSTNDAIDSKVGDGMEKEPWQMTRDEFAEHMGYNTIYDGVNIQEFNGRVADISNSLSEKIGNRISTRLKTTDFQKVLDFYKKKFNLSDIKIEYDLPVVQGKPLAVAEMGFISGNGSIIHLPKKDARVKPEKILGYLRHEIEHIKDNEEGYTSQSATRSRVNESQAKGKSIQQIYREYWKGHHKNYDLFELDYYHKALVRDAIEEGKEIPDSVLIQYSDLKQVDVKAYDDKKVWEMPKTVYIQRNRHNPNADKAHRIMVEKAKARGEHIPDEVKADYPDIFETPSIQEGVGKKIKTNRETPPGVFSIGDNQQPDTAQQPTAKEKPQAVENIIEENNQLQKGNNKISYGRAGKVAYEKWGNNEYVNADLNKPDDEYTQAFTKFFEFYYNKGLNGEKFPMFNERFPVGKYNFPPFLEDIFYNAGIKDLETKNKRENRKEEESEQNTATNGGNNEESKTENKLERDAPFPMTENEILDIVKNYLNELQSNMELEGLDFKIVDMALYGSRVRGDYTKNSDIDVLIEYEGDAREDDMYNALNFSETYNGKLKIDEIEVDINPIKKEKSGTIREFLERNKNFVKRPELLGTNSTKEEKSSKTLADYGLEVRKTKTNRGNDVWHVPTNDETKKYLSIFHKLKARWYKPHPKAKAVWAFNYDPTEDLLKELADFEGDNTQENTDNNAGQERRIINNVNTTRGVSDLSKVSDEGIIEGIDSLPKWIDHYGKSIENSTPYKDNYKDLETLIAEARERGLSLNKQQNNKPSKENIVKNQEKEHNENKEENTGTKPINNTVKQIKETFPEGPVKNNLAWLDAQAELARQRLKERHKNIRLNAGLPMDDLVDYSIIGADKLANGVVEFSQWSKEMLEEFGDNLRLFLRAIYGQSEAMLEMSPEDIQEMLELAKKEDNNTLKDLNKTDATGTTEENIPNSQKAEHNESKEENIKGGEKDVKHGLLDRQDESISGGNEGRRTSEGEKETGKSETANASGNTSGRSTGLGTRTTGDNKRTQPDNGILEETSKSNNPSGKSELSVLDSGHSEGNSLGFDISKNLNYRFKDIELDFTKPNFNDNYNAIEVLKKIEKEDREATPEEQTILSKYKGWGGLKSAFVEPKRGFNGQLHGLHQVLTNEEFNSAKASIRNAHYTSLELIEAIYKGLSAMEFKGGKILEPSMGTGNFFGMLPQDIASKSHLYGVELDSITGKIAQKLYPKANIQISGFQDVNFKDNFFDVVIGNVPFGEATLNYKGHGYKLHDYFFVKSIDKLKEGGILVFITSSGTMDKLNDKMRQKIMSQADLIAAYRLPDTSFKTNAGTEVTTDLIILRKREEGRPYAGEEWQKVGKIEGIPVNEYFVNHPKNLLGQLVYEKNMYAKERTQLKSNGRDVIAELTEAMQKLPQIYSNKKGAEVKVENGEIENTFCYKKFTYVEHNGELYYVNNDVLKPVKQEKQKIKDYMKIKETFMSLISGNNKAADRKQLNELYDKFVETNGYLNSAKNSKPFREDAEYPKVAGIEIYDYETKKYNKAEIFTKDTNIKKRVEKVDTSYDALIVSLGETARIDMKRMSELTGKPEEVIADELSEHITKDNDGDYQLIDVYLSGNIRNKLSQAKNLAKRNPEYQKNVELLEKAMPIDKKADEITPQLGSPWIGADYIKEFCRELGVDIEDSSFGVTYEPLKGTWAVYTPKSKNSYKKYNQYQTREMSFFKLLENTLNMKTITIYDKDEKGHRYVNTKGTENARLKAKMLKDAFEEWIFKDSDRRNALVERFNKLFNSYKNMEYEKVAKYLRMNDVKNVNLRAHQLKAVARIIYGGDTLLAHGVGSGKTYEMIGASHELIRSGVSNKNMMVVPNHKLSDFEADYKNMYPDAKILVATKKDFEPANRIKLFTKIASNNWECIIAPHSSFRKIPISPEKQAEYIQTEVDELRSVLDEIRVQSGKKENTRFIKNLENTLDNMENKLKTLLDTPKDESVYFDDMGIGALFVDEAHNFKNLAFYTKLNVPNVKNSASQRAADMFIKTGLVREQGGRIIFATATPITNSVSEMYNMLRFVSPSTLEESGIKSFDAWAATFGQIEMKMEMSTDSKSFRAKERFAKYKNVQAMVGMFRQVADVIKTSDVIKDLPTAERINVVSEPNEYLEEFLNEITHRIEKIKNSGSDSSDNMLLITNDGRAAATDLRLVSKLLNIPNKILDIENSKINKAVENIYKEYKEGSKNKLTQLVFLDFGINEGGGRYGFNLYDDLIKKLVNVGIPRKEIATIHEAVTEQEKEQLFGDMNKGIIRVLIGSTAKMGEGMNVQQRAIALHHLNSPYRPSDIEQREGRIIRQGNKNKNARIYTYIQEKSFDSYMWQMLSRKQEFISQAMSGEFIGSELEEVDDFVLSANSAMAIATGNPIILQKVEVDQKVKELEGYKAAYRKNMYQYDDIVKKYPEENKKIQERIEGYKKDLETLENHEWVTETAKDDNTIESLAKFEIKIGDRVYNDKEDAGEAIREASKEPNENYTTIGEYKGFKLVYLKYKTTLGYIVDLILKGEERYETSLSESNTGTIQKLDNALNKISPEIEEYKKVIEERNAAIEEAKEILAKPFKYEKELSDALMEQARINGELGINVAEIINEDKVSDFEDTDGTEEDEEENKNSSKRSTKSYSMVGQAAQMPNGDESSKLEDTKTVDEIVAIIEKTIKVPIRTGKFRQRAYGIFKEVPEVIRTKVTNDLPTICHEVGHYLDKKFGLDNLQFKDELMALGKPVSRKSYTKEQVRAEGIAEFVRLYLTDQRQARLRTPKFLQYFETVLDRDSLMSLNSIRTDILKVVNLSDVDKVKNDISVGETRKATKQEKGFKEIRQKLYDAWIDEYAPFTRVAKRAIEAGYNGEALNTAVKIYRGFEGKVLGNITMAQIDLNGNVVGKSFDEILKPIKKNEVDDFRAYMVSRRAIDYHRRNMVMPQTYSTYYNTLIALDNKYPHFQDTFNELREWENNEMQLLVDSGVYSQDTVDEMKKNNPNHVPLYRIQEAVEAVYGGSGSTLGQSKKVVKQARGSGKTIIDPLESMIFNAFIIRRAAEANQINSMLADMADNIEGFGELVEAVPPGVKGFTFNVEEIGKTLQGLLKDDVQAEIDARRKKNPNDNMIPYLEVQKEQINVKNMNLDKLVTLFRANYRERDNEITVCRNGKPKLYQVETELYRAIKGLNREASHFIIRALNVPKRILQTGAVTTLQFVMRNMARDTSTSLIQSEAGINPIDIVKGYASAFKKDKWFKQWVLSGGATEYLQVNERTQVQSIFDDVMGYTLIEKLQDAIKKPTKEKLTRLLFTPINKIRGAMEWSEAGPRAAEFRKAVEKGYSQEKAAALSRDLSQDFKRYGYYGKELNKITAFFNANLQGIEKQLRTFRAHPYLTLLRGFLYVTLPTMLLYFWNDDNDEYKSMAVWRKALFYNIPLGNRKTATHFLSIPKPYGWGYWFGALLETILDGIKNDDPKMWKDIRDNFVINFDIPLIPSAVSPTLETMTNKSWNKTPIENYGDSFKPSYLRKNENSSMTAVGLANILKDVPGVNKISPKQLDYLVKGYGGSVGDFFWRLPDTVKKGVELPTDYTNYPVIKTFITDTAYSNRSINDFYTYGKELNDRLKEAQETGTYRAIPHLSENEQKVLQSAIKNATKEYNSLADEFSDARGKIREIKANSKYSPAEKKLREREILLKVAKIAEKFIKKYEAFKKNNKIK